MKTELGEMEYFVFRGQRVYYLKAGKGKPIVFLHNGGNSHAIWKRQVEYFADSHTCIATDLPGYGMSVNPDMRYSLKYYVDFIESFLGEVADEPATLVGNCIGSAISLSHAMEKPENVERLILFNVLTKKTVFDGMLGMLFKLTEPIPEIRPILRSIVGDFVPPMFARKQTLRSQYGKAGLPGGSLDAELLEVYAQKGNVGALVDILVSIDEFKPLDDFTISDGFPPTLVIWGTENKILPYKAGRTLVENLHPNRFEPINGAGHLAMYEAADDVNLIMSDFLG